MLARKMLALLFLGFFCFVTNGMSQIPRARSNSRSSAPRLRITPLTQEPSKSVSPAKEVAAPATTQAHASSWLALSRKAPKHPINVEVMGTKPDVTAIQVSSGWPITVRLSANNELGIGVPENVLFSPYPTLWHKGYIVFSDPDGCWSWLNPQEQNEGCASPPPYPFDEKWLEFRPDIDLPGVIDVAGGGTLGGNPLLNLFDIEAQINRPLPIGPDTGGTVSDGYGFGHDDDLPGLMVLSDAGVGLVYDLDFNLQVPLTLRNLAGLGQSVSYVLNDNIPTKTQSGRAVVEWHMNAPPGLMVPVVLKDGCVGAPPTQWPSCDQPAIYRMDGGPQTTLMPSPGAKVITVRVFVVNGTAPNTLSDENGDGIVNSDDAKMAGLTVLSDEAVFSFVVVQQGMDQAYLIDFDGNGSGGGIVIPAGSGGLTGRPR